MLFMPIFCNVWFLCFIDIACLPLEGKAIELNLMQDSKRIGEGRDKFWLFL